MRKRKKGKGKKAKDEEVNGQGRERGYPGPMRGTKTREKSLINHWTNAEEAMFPLY